MMNFIRPTLLAVIVLEIMSLFYLLHIYDKFVSDPQNFTSTAVINRQAKKSGAGTDLDKLLDISAPSSAPAKKK
jgi:hypothetical protein